jgi:Flp pilus assembly protein TadG
MVLRPSAHSRDRRRATAAVEFAVVLPFLATLILGTFELSRAILVKEIVEDAARRGCRSAIQPNSTNSSVTTEINNILSDHGISTGSASITILVNGASADVSTANRQDEISVKVGVPVSQVFWATTLFLPGTTIESEVVVMMCQA